MRTMGIAGADTTLIFGGVVLSATTSLLLIIIIIISPNEDDRGAFVVAASSSSAAGGGGGYVSGGRSGGQRGVGGAAAADQCPRQLALLSRKARVAQEIVGRLRHALTVRVQAGQQHGGGAERTAQPILGQRGQRGVGHLHKNKTAINTFVGCTSI